MRRRNCRPARGRRVRRSGRRTRPPRKRRRTTGRRRGHRSGRRPRRSCRERRTTEQRPEARPGCRRTGRRTRRGRRTGLRRADHRRGPRLDQGPGRRRRSGCRWRGRRGDPPPRRPECLRTTADRGCRRGRRWSMGRARSFRWTGRRALTWCPTPGRSGECPRTAAAATSASAGRAPSVGSHRTELCPAGWWPRRRRCSSGHPRRCRPAGSWPTPRRRPVRPWCTWNGAVLLPDHPSTRGPVRPAGLTAPVPGPVLALVPALDPAPDLAPALALGMALGRVLVPSPRPALSRVLALVLASGLVPSPALALALVPVPVPVLARALAPGLTRALRSGPVRSGQGRGPGPIRSGQGRGPGPMVPRRRTRRPGRPGAGPGAVRLRCSPGRAMARRGQIRAEVRRAGRRGRRTARPGPGTVRPERGPGTRGTGRSRRQSGWMSAGRLPLCCSGRRPGWGRTCRSVRRSTPRSTSSFGQRTCRCCSRIPWCTGETRPTWRPAGGPCRRPVTRPPGGRPTPVDTRGPSGRRIRRPDGLRTRRPTVRRARGASAHRLGRQHRWRGPRRRGR